MRGIRVNHEFDNGVLSLCINPSDVASARLTVYPPGGLPASLWVMSREDAEELFNLLNNMKTLLGKKIIEGVFK